MSDTNHDVVPQESVVDLPSTHEALEPQAELEEIPEEAEAPEPDAEEEPVSLDGPDADPEAPEEDVSEDDEGEAEEDSKETAEVIEFDFGGNKLEVKAGEVPPELAEKIDTFSKEIWADYTKKSQANAESAKSLGARAAALDNIETLTGEALDVFSRGKGIKAEIEQLSAVNMQALWQSDPDRARMLSDTLSAKQAELHGIIESVDQYEQNISSARQGELERRAAEGKQVLDRKYKGFSSDVAPKLEAYAVEQGIPEAEAKTWASSPIVAEFAYKAMLYDQMQKAKTPKEAPKTAKPVSAMKNKGGSRTSSNPNNMSFSELGKVLGIS